MDSHHNVHYCRLEGAQASGGIPTSDGTHQIRHDMESTVMGDGRYPNATGLCHWTRKTQDPIQRLPSELATLVIYESLPSYTGYTARLIDLTTVSQRWQRFLWSKAILWSQLYVDEREPDFLATLAVSVHLSGRVPLKCVIYDYLLQDWTGVASVLMPVYKRITVLTVRRSIINCYSEDPYACLYVLSALFDHLEPLPNVTDVIFDDVLNFTTAQIRSLGLSRGVRYTCTIRGSEILWGVRNPRIFDEIAFGHFGTTPALLSDSLFFRVEITHRWKAVHSGATLPRLQHIMKFFDKLGNVWRSMWATGIRLFHLDIGVPLSEIADLVGCLRQLMSLQELHLVIAIDSIDAKRDIYRSGDKFVDLRRLQVHLTPPFGSGVFRPETYSGGVHDTFGALSEAFKEMYPGIKVFNWQICRSFDIWHAFPSPYLQSLGGIESLELEETDAELNQVVVELNQADEELEPTDEELDQTNEELDQADDELDQVQADVELDRTDVELDRADEELSQVDVEETSLEYPIIMWSLRDLRVSNLDLCRLIETPNLLRLETAMHGSQALANVDIQRLRKLVVTNADDGFHFNELHFPELRELKLTINGTAMPFMDSRLFPRLVSITLNTSSFWFTNPPGTLLCLELLYHPDHFPFLQQLCFNLCVEWDILFLMLESRNLGTKYVTRIHTVDLPFVPFSLRRSLTLLLAGERTEYPSLIHLSLEETREVTFDATVQGCAFCLKNMVPGCCGEAKINPDRWNEPWDPAELYPKFDDPPDTLPVETQEWLNQRRYLVDLWGASHDSFQKNFRRVDICRRFLRQLE